MVLVSFEHHDIQLVLPPWRCNHELLKSTEFSRMNELSGSAMKYGESVYSETYESTLRVFSSRIAVPHVYFSQLIIINH